MPILSNLQQHSIPGSGYGFSAAADLPEDYADLGVSLLWDCTEPWPSHGNFVPCPPEKF